MLSSCIIILGLENLDELPKAEFVQGLFKELINNEVYANYKAEEVETSKKEVGKREKGLKNTRSARYLLDLESGMM